MICGALKPNGAVISDSVNEQDRASRFLACSKSATSCRSACNSNNGYLVAISSLYSWLIKYHTAFAECFKSRQGRCGLLTNDHYFFCQVWHVSTDLLPDELSVFAWVALDVLTCGNVNPLALTTKYATVTSLHLISTPEVLIDSSVFCKADFVDLSLIVALFTVKYLIFFTFLNRRSFYALSIYYNSVCAGISHAHHFIIITFKIETVENLVGFAVFYRNLYAFAVDKLC